MLHTMLRWTHNVCIDNTPGTIVLILLANSLSTPTAASVKLVKQAYGSMADQVRQVSQGTQRGISQHRAVRTILRHPRMKGGNFGFKSEAAVMYSRTRETGMGSNPS